MHTVIYNQAINVTDFLELSAVVHEKIENMLFNVCYRKVEKSLKHLVHGIPLFEVMRSPGNRQT